MLEILEILEDLCSINGVSGREEKVREYIIKKISGYCRYTVDPLGNILVHKDGSYSPEKKVMFDAHMDEVGLIITSISSDGSLKFQTVGRIDPSVLISKRVIIENNITGVIGAKPVHLLSESEKSGMPDLSSLSIDIGASSKEEAEALVKLGDVACFDTQFEKMGDLFVSKALDDRIGCAVLIDLIRSELDYGFCASFSVQEEVGLRGATVAAYTLSPDAAIVLEATTAQDIYGVENEKRVTRLGKGVAISFMDGTTLYDKKLFDLALSIGEDFEIPVQIKTAVAGGNDSGAIHRSKGGVRTITLSVPCRYLHSPVCVISEKDILAQRRMAEKLLYKIASQRNDD